MKDEQINKLVDAVWSERALFLGQLPCFARRELLDADVRAIVKRDGEQTFHTLIKRYEAQMQA